MTAESKERGRRGRLFGGLCLLFLLLGGGWAAYWHLFLRGVETTDDAYVAGNLVRVSPRVGGTVREILADNTQTVLAGRTLVRLDDADAVLALHQALDSLADAVRKTRARMSESERLLAAVELRKRELARRRGDYERRKDLKTSIAVSEEDKAHSRDNLAEAETALAIARRAYEANNALLLDTPLRDQPPVRLQAHRVREAWLAVRRCEIKSPVNGQIARRSVQVGMRVAPGDPLMAVVPLKQVWIDANFKEVQLARMRVGQPVTVRADMYGASVTYKGTVEGLAAGTGSVFSLLPPENATGNWIKVVQRVPVKIVLDARQLEEAPLLVGLSCAVTVDVSNAGGRMLNVALPPASLYRTTALDQDLADIDREIEAVIAAHDGPPERSEDAGSPRSASAGPPPSAVSAAETSSALKPRAAATPEPRQAGASRSRRSARTR